MGKFEIGINHIGAIYLRVKDNELRIDDESNGGIIQCTAKNLRETIRIIEEAYEKCHDLNPAIYGYGCDTINLTKYQSHIGKHVFWGNYIKIRHMPTIIKMLKSVKAEKKKYILNKDSLSGLSIDDLVYLKQTIRRRKKVLTDNNGYKYIEVQRC